MDEISFETWLILTIPTLIIIFFAAGGGEFIDNIGRYVFRKRKP